MTGGRQAGASSPVGRAATGPRTAAGKMRSRRNARRHGLAVPVCLDPEVSPAIDNVAHQIAGPAASSAVMQLARLAAEAQLDVIRCRQARCRTFEDKRDDEEGIFDELFNDPFIMRFLLKQRWGQSDGKDSAAFGLNGLPEETLNYYWKRALTRRKRSRVKELIAIDRYERRALLRRNRALRDIDCQRLIEAVSSSRVGA
jgi:hypothetical protein